MPRRARDVVLDILREEGVTHVFANPGSTEMPLMDALVDAPDIKYVLGLQEATAVGMAARLLFAARRAAVGRGFALEPVLHPGQEKRLRGARRGEVALVSR